MDGRGDETHYAGLLVSGDGLTWRVDTLPKQLASTHDWEWRITALPVGLLAFEQATGPAAQVPKAFVGVPVPAADPGPAPVPDRTPAPSPSGAIPPEVTWTVGPTTMGTRVADVVAWNGRYVAVGYAAGAESGEFLGPAAWISDDGLTWTQTMDPADFPGTPSTGAPRMLRIAVNGGTIVVAGEAPGPIEDDVSSPVAAFWRSSDGLTWQRVPDRPEFAIGVTPFADRWVTGLFDLAAGGPGFVAVGATRSDGATIWTSTDGLDWRRTATLGEATVSGIYRGGPGMVATGFTGGPNSSDLAWTSSDGIAWSPANVPPDALPQPGFERTINEEGVVAVVPAPWGFVGAGTLVCPDALVPCPAAWTAADGIRWDESMLPLADPGFPPCPSCRVTPVAAAVDGRRIVVVGSTFTIGGPFDTAPGWASWVGTLNEP